MNNGTTQQDPRGADKAPNLVNILDLIAQYINSIEGETIIYLDKKRELSIVESNALYTRKNAIRGDKLKEKIKNRDQIKSIVDNKR